MLLGHVDLGRAMDGDQPENKTYGVPSVWLQGWFGYSDLSPQAK